MLHLKSKYTKKNSYLQFFLLQSSWPVSLLVGSSFENHGSSQTFRFRDKSHASSCFMHFIDEEG
jgi:hypothetical protein